MSGAADRGSTGLVTVLAVALLLAVGGACLLAVADLAATATRARAAADAAALAAAGTSPLVTGTTGGHHLEAIHAARSTAAANGARLVATDLDRWPLRVHVEVTVAPSSPWVGQFVPNQRAGATAAVRPATASAIGKRV